MSDPYKNIDTMFLQLVLSMQASAMQQMGKIASMISGKIERDLKAAQFTIDVLDMIEKKTKGNLSDEEAKLLGHVLYELRLNYVDESKRPDESVETDKPAEPDENKSEPTDSDSSEEESAKE